MVKTQLLWSSNLTNPLGSISVAGTIKNSTGIGHSKMRILGSYALVYLLEGSGRYRDALGRNVKVQAGDVCLLFPDLAHSYGPETGERWSEIYLAFDGPLFNLWRQADCLFESCPIVPLQPIPYWRNQIAYVLPKNNYPTEQIASLCRLQLLLTEMQPFARPPALAVPAWLEKAERILKNSPEEKIPLPTLARRLGLSYESFRKNFKKLTGLSPAQYHLTERIRAASSLLYSYELSNKQIAERLGFSDEFHFAKLFKKFTGQTPRTFRQRLPQ